MTLNSKNNPLLAALREYAAEQPVTHEIIQDVTSVVIGYPRVFQRAPIIRAGMLNSDVTEAIHAWKVLKRLHYLTLNTTPECVNCGEELDEEDGRERFADMCTSCVHDAERCGA